MIDKNEEKSDIKPNEFEKIICNAIDNEKFIFKYQPLQCKDKNREILEVLTKIYSKSRGNTLSYSHTKSN